MTPNTAFSRICAHYAGDGKTAAIERQAMCGEGMSILTQFLTDMGDDATTAIDLVLRWMAWRRKLAPEKATGAGYAHQSAQKCMEHITTAYQFALAWSQTREGLIRAVKQPKQNPVLADVAAADPEPDQGLDAEQQALMDAFRARNQTT